MNASVNPESNNGVANLKSALSDTADQINDSAHRVGSVANEKFQELFAGVQDLINQVNDVDSAELRKIQAKLRVSLVAAKSALADGASTVRRQAQSVAKTTDGYVRSSPWQALGLAAVAGFAVGILVSRRD
jgi:ElaB/YqjD/DUF883 family membrane-anchored ribosome-binding protein